MDSRCSLPSNALVGGGNDGVALGQGQGYSLVCVRVLNFSSRCAAFGRRQSLRQLVEQHFGVDQIFRIEAFGEPVVNRLQQIECLFAFAL